MTNNILSRINTPLRRLKTLFRAAALICLPAASSLIHAEGAVRVFACQITQQCDATGACKPASEPMHFRMAPQTLDASGAGQYLLDYGQQQQLPMQALSEIGPFVWVEGDEHHTLVISSETALLWHTLSLTAAPASSVRFLACTLQQ